MKWMSPPHRQRPMNDSTPVSIDEPRPQAATVPATRPPRLASPADRDSPRARPESDPDLWVAVAAELAE